MMPGVEKLNITKELTLDMAGPPISGVLAMNIKSVQLNATEDQGTNSNFYVKLSVRNTCQRTGVSGKERGTIAWNQLFHVPMLIEDNPRHPFNLIHVRLMTFNSHHSAEHTEVGIVRAHLHEVIRNSPSSTTLTLLRNLRIVGSLEVEFYFSYGILGYGYSELMTTSSLPQGARSAFEEYKDVENLKYSMYPRVDPTKLDPSLLDEDDTRPSFLEEQKSTNSGWYSPAGTAFTSKSSAGTSYGSSKVKRFGTGPSISASASRESRTSYYNDTSHDDPVLPNFPLLAKQMTHLRPLQLRLRDSSTDNRLQRLGLLFKQMSSSVVREETSTSVGLNSDTATSRNHRFTTFLKPTIHFLQTNNADVNESDNSEQNATSQADDDTTIADYLISLNDDC